VRGVEEGDEEKKEGPKVEVDRIVGFQGESRLTGLLSTF
jgi:hypothetical protein